MLNHPTNDDTAIIAGILRVSAIATGHTSEAAALLAETALDMFWEQYLRAAAPYGRTAHGMLAWLDAPDPIEALRPPGPIELN